MSYEVKEHFKECTTNGARNQEVIAVSPTDSVQTLEDLKNIVTYLEQRFAGLAFDDISVSGADNLEVRVNKATLDNTPLPR